jgi:hypothetical protein
VRGDPRQGALHRELVEDQRALEDEHSLLVPDRQLHSRVEQQRRDLRRGVDVEARGGALLDDVGEAGAFPCAGTAGQGDADDVGLLRVLPPRRRLARIGLGSPLRRRARARAGVWSSGVLTCRLEGEWEGERASGVSGCRTINCSAGSIRCSRLLPTRRNAAPSASSAADGSSSAAGLAPEAHSSSPAALSPATAAAAAAAAVEPVSILGVSATPLTGSVPFRCRRVHARRY